MSAPSFVDKQHFVSHDWEQDGQFLKMVTDYFIQPRGFEVHDTDPSAEAAPEHLNVHGARNAWFTIPSETFHRGSITSWWNFGDLPRPETIDFDFQDNDIFELSSDGTLSFNVQSNVLLLGDTGDQIMGYPIHWESGIYEFELGHFGLVWSGNPTILRDLVNGVDIFPSNFGDGTGIFSSPTDVSELPSSGVVQNMLHPVGPDAEYFPDPEPHEGEFETSHCRIVFTQIFGTFTIYRPVSVSLVKPEPVQIILDPRVFIEAEKFHLPPMFDVYPIAKVRRASNRLSGDRYVTRKRI